MAGLLTTMVCRHPRPAPAAVAEQAAIHTHPSQGPSAAPSAMQRALSAPAEATDATATDLPRKGKEAAPTAAAATSTASTSLYHQLFASWSEKDWAGLAVAARRHLSASGPAPALHPITEAAAAFFRPWETDLQAGDTERFLRGIGDEGLRTYFARDAERDRSRLADDALALQCLGMLGRAPFDYAGALRAIEALTVSARLMDLGADELGISVGLIRRIGEMEVFLPRWSCQIDPCRHSDSDEGWPRESPLERKIDQLEQRKIRLAEPGDCCCAREEVCTPPDPCCAKVNYYVAELLELRDWTHRYKAGDIAYIENVAAGETRSREHEMKRTRELFSETEITDRQSETRDFQVTDRSSLKREIERQQEQSFSAEASATGSYNSGAYKATLSASTSFARSASEAIREAQEHAVETVKKAVSEIEKQTRTKRSEKITTEETEKNLHSFINATEEALVTKYFWVTKECRAQLYSYGKQMIAEFIVPEPARLYEHLLYRRREDMIDQRVAEPKATEPVPPAAIGFTASSLTAENYKSLAAQWGVQDPPGPPAPASSLALNYSEGTDREDGVHVTDLAFQVPAGYAADSWNFDGEVKYRLLGNPKKVSASCGGSDLWKDPDGGQTYGSLPDLTGSQSVSLFASRTDSFAVTVIIYMHLLPGGLAIWQQAVFELVQTKHDDLTAAYAEAKAKYDAIIAAYEAERDKVRQELIEAEKSRHPFFNREIERTELKRAVIYLMCQDFSVDGAMIRKAEPCGFPEIDRSATDREGYDWYFWDRLIDWKRMAYAFFDYFWNPICDWPQRFDPDEADALFKAFRRAGYARVLVPVSPAMHKDFLWYLATHEKWNQEGPPFGDQDPRWRNVVFELKHANDAAMTAREGHLDVANGSNVVTIKGSDRYYSPAGTGLPDPAMIALDIDREIYVDGEVYLIVGIAPNPGSPPYNVLTPDTGWWDVTLDRAYAGATGTGRLYALGAKAVAPAFSFDMPTELIWAGDKGRCLPTYPLPPCVP